MVEEEDKSESESSSEYEEYTDSEDETGPRLKPVFVPRTDRVTIKEKEAQAREEQALEQEKKKQSDLRKRESHRVRYLQNTASIKLIQNWDHTGNFFLRYQFGCFYENPFLAK